MRLVRNNKSGYFLPGYDQWNSLPQSSEKISSGFEEINNTSTEAVPSVRLFDVDADPEERHDVTELFPEIVDIMLEKIAAYNKTAVPINFPVGDVRCNPALRGDVWGPWA